MGAGYLVVVNLGATKAEEIIFATSIFSFLRKNGS